MNSSGSNDDCYFYYYSSCTKGDDCPFRHCKAALGTETVCNSWREGKCKRNNCKFRHMESRINRRSIQCYWEDQPSGCLKPHCVFFHRKRTNNVKPNAGIEGLILPVSANSPETAPYDSEVCPASIPIEPIVFSIDSEESDSESPSSSPIKSTSNDSISNPASAMKNLNEFSSNDDDYGITTLELLKIEKLLKEPDNFYKYDYEAPLTDPSHSKMKTLKVELYSRKNLRNKLLNRRNTSVYSEKLVPSMKTVNLKKTKDDNLDFKIKTSDEIRNKKMNKLADSSSDSQKKERNQMILREVQNIAADQNKVVNKGKRKYISSNCTDEKNPKQLKMNNSNSSKNILGVRESKEKQVKCSRPTTKRKRLTSSYQTSVSQTKKIPSTFESVIQPVSPEKTEKATSKENILSKEEDSFKRVPHKDKSTPKSLVDDTDSFRLNEVNVTLDHKPAASTDESDDIVFEIEQMLRELSL